MNTLPKTSPESYLTGSTAFNIPMSNGDFSDWHFTTTFFGEKTKFRITGQNFIDTSSVLGNYGVRECSDVLRRYGVAIPNGDKVYVADFTRALLDMVYNNILENRVPEHLKVDDVLDDESMKTAFFEKLQDLKSKINNQVHLTLITQWESQQ